MAKPARSSLTVVPPFVCKDTLEFAERLLLEVQRGEVVGIAAAVMLRKKTFFVDVRGSNARDLVSTRGIVACLDDEVRRLIDEWADSSPTRPDFV